MKRVLAALVAASVILFPSQFGPPTVAQQLTTQYSLRLTREQAENLLRVWNEHLAYVPGELLVKFRSGSAPSSQLRALSTLRDRGTPLTTRWIGDVLLVRAPDEPDPVGAAAMLERQPEIEWAQPNYWRPVSSTPNDPSLARQWNFELINLPRAWDINPGGKSTITVAVVDSGITVATADHRFVLWTGSRFEAVTVPVRANPDIASARILPGRDFIFWDGPVIDFQGHGTHVAGTVLQETNNAIAFAGIAYQAKLLPLKACVGYWEVQFIQSAFGIPGFVDPTVSGGCSDAAVAEAIQFAADNGAHIINLSLGGPDPSPIYREAILYAVQRGAFVSIAVGNEFEEGNPTNYPAAYAASIDGAVAVGAVGRSSRRAFYSNTGAHVELVAPGGDVRDGGLGGTIYQVGLFSPDFDPITIVRPRFDRYAEVPQQGTSMAAPHVAGVAALLHSQGINRPSAIEAALKRFAKDLGPSGRDNEYGHGLIDARMALRGFGVTR
jgi:serine protease